jgi:hypothetical protein
MDCISVIDETVPEPGPLMRLKLRVDGRRTRRWHIDLLRRIATLPGVVATVDHTPGAGLADASMDSDLLLRLDALLHREQPGAAAAARPSDLDPYCHPAAERADLILDLCGDVPAESGRVWRLLFDGAPGDTALLRLVLSGRTPFATICEAGRAAGPADLPHAGGLPYPGRPVASGRLGAERHGSALAAFEDMLARTATLIMAALAGASRSVPALPGDEAPVHHGPPVTPIGLGGILARKLARTAVRSVYRLCYTTPHWRVGWRRLDGGADVIGLRGHPASGWNVLPDDGSRFYADPFPIAHDGRVTLFVEDFSHRIGKGIISAVEFGPGGPIGRPQPVLDLPYHLSYPFVFARDGEMWMVPESCAAGTVDLYRATSFPGGWVKEATLLSDIVASDATLVEHGGRWWMFATVRDQGGAFSDALHLWSAPDFRGPWTAHPANPVLIDIASARPAGRIVMRDGALLRPVQDCRRGYGAALAIARIQRLDETGFEQTVETILTPGPQWPGRRLHTLNSAGGLEFIDGSARVRRWF